MFARFTNLRGQAKGETTAYLMPGPRSGFIFLTCRTALKTRDPTLIRRQ